jgi:hypothetical protein
MTHTTTRQATHLQALPTYSLQGSSGKQPLRWIFLCWSMLSLVGEVPIPWDVGTIVLGKQVSFDGLGLNLSIFMSLWFL